MTDENDNVKTMVNSLADGDNVAAQSAFKDALTDKIGAALDDKRQTVANDWLNAAQDLEATKDASGLDSVGIAPEGIVGTEEETPEPIEIDQDEKEDEQPVV
tara:strand:+ start:579 stop:884 length:306 start_codon:yes stop_codon:yes gene_type:complete